MTEPTMDTTSRADGQHDFDFLIGHWTVRHRRLKARLAGCSDWESFAGHATMQPLMGGQANVDDNLLKFPGGSCRAASLRCFDPRTGLWAIWWLDARRPQQIDVPVRGRFEGGVGRFHADDQLDGRPIRVRFVWCGITPHAAHWEQAFSADGGRSWETNWVMDFERDRTPA